MNVPRAPGVMPYMDGESLRDRLRRERQLPVPDALAILREVADALEYGHTLGIIHRDIKPGNILPAGGHARLGDFGIARVVAAANRSAREARRAECVCRRSRARTRSRCPARRSRLDGAPRRSAAARDAGAAPLSREGSVLLDANLSEMLRV